MSRYVEFTLADGSKIVMESDEVSEKTGAVVKASRSLSDLTRQASETFEDAAENARKTASVILENIRGLHDSPDEIEVCFGLKASGELGSLVVAKASVEANYGIKLRWKTPKSRKAARPFSIRYSRAPQNR